MRIYTTLWSPTTSKTGFNPISLRITQSGVGSPGLAAAMTSDKRDWRGHCGDPVTGRYHRDAAHACTGAPAPGAWARNTFAVLTL